MNEYRAPLRDMRFVMRELAHLEEITSLPGCDAASSDTVDAILEEAGKFATEVLAPLNRSGDREGAIWHNGEVTMPKGFKEAYAAFVANGWNGIACESEFGGQGMPKLVTAAVREVWNSANMAFSLCPALNAGAIEALALSASHEIKSTFLPRMVSGEWAGSMNLTEPQAGSDLAAIKTVAKPQADGTYRIFGQKIFITYGEHDLAENIVHLVLARLPNAPPGTKGISMFVVPKYLVQADGSLGKRNDVCCVSIEHKLGIHASPTCVMSFGEQGGAIGYLVGEANRGLEYMFIMMNDARMVSGLQGLAIAERAYQQAATYAKERVQGRDIGGGRESVAIVRHPDVRRMLFEMKSQIEAMRALAYVVAAALDAAECHPDADRRAAERAFAALMTPVVKGWCTETGIEVASLGIQVHGGMGYIEETGAAQYLRDVRITAIYEGTTGIQANDLMGRKVAADGGASARRLLAEMRALSVELSQSSDPDLKAIGNSLATAVKALAGAVDHVVANYSNDIHATTVSAVPFLKLFGKVTGGWLMARAAMLSAERRQAQGAEFYDAKIATTRFYADHILVSASGLAATVCNGAGRVMELDEAYF